LSALNAPNVVRAMALNGIVTLLVAELPRAGFAGRTQEL
jgi:hypothetical protein